MDDTPTALEVIQRNLSASGYRIYTASNAVDAIQLLENIPIDIVITDYKMPKVSGLDLIRHVRENYYNTEVIMITGYASVKGAVEAVKMGAEEYLPKPFTDEELFAAVELALKKLELHKTVRDGKPRVDPKSFGILGKLSLIHI